MDPPLADRVLDPVTCRLLSVEEKRALVRELSKWPVKAQDKLLSWTRRDILEILCADLGKDKKFTGLSKQRMMEYLFKVVSGSPSESSEKSESVPEAPKANLQTSSKRQRKNDNPSRLPIMVNSYIATNSISLPSANISLPTATRYCENSACRATLNKEDTFCRHCNCCICYNYDDNKDPSLWLFCSSEPRGPKDPSHNSCGLSCHIECALKDKRSGILKCDQHEPEDGFYLCVSCKKQNDLLGCWRKQLLVAKDARRLDVLCHRIFLSHSLLSFSVKHQALHEIVDSAKKMLENEVGPITAVPTMGRGIVSRLSVGVEVQKLCSQAIEALDSRYSVTAEVQKPARSELHQGKVVPPNFLKFEEIGSMSVTLLLDLENQPALSECTGFTFWNRVVGTAVDLSEPAGTLLLPNRRILISKLIPDVEYVLRVIAFNNYKELGSWEVQVKTMSLLAEKYPLRVDGVRAVQHESPKYSSGLSNPSSEGVESNNNTAVYADLNKSPEIEYEECEDPEILDSEKATHQINSLIEDSKNPRDVLVGETIRAEALGMDVVQCISLSALDDELTLSGQAKLQKESSESMKLIGVEDVPNSEDASNATIADKVVVVPHGCTNTGPQYTPNRMENGKEICTGSIRTMPHGDSCQNANAKPEREPGSSSNKRSLEKFEEATHKDECCEQSYEYCVKVIRWLEREGFIERNFRVKFLTWFSLRATVHERKIVNVFINTMIDDPLNLAGQLIDSFSEVIFSKKPHPPWLGRRMDLWHLP